MFLKERDNSNRRQSGSALVYVVLATAAATAIALTSMSVVLSDTRYAVNVQRANDAEEMAQSAMQEGIAVLSKNLPIDSYSGLANRYFSEEDCATLKVGISSNTDCPRYELNIHAGQRVDKDHPYEIWTSDIKTTGYTQDFGVSASGDGLQLKRIDDIFMAKHGVQEVVCTVIGANNVLLNQKNLSTDVCDVGIGTEKVNLTMTYKPVNSATGEGYPDSHQPVVRVEAKVGGSSGTEGSGSITFGSRIQIYAAGYSAGDTAVRRYGISYYQLDMTDPNNPMGISSYEEKPGSRPLPQATFKKKPISGYVNSDGTCNILNACR